MEKFHKRNFKIANVNFLFTEQMNAKTTVIDVRLLTVSPVTHYYNAISNKCILKLTRYMSQPIEAQSNESAKTLSIQPQEQDKPFPRNPSHLTLNDPVAYQCM